MKQAHFTLQAKGGIGKSITATMLAQFFASKGVELHCIDIDQENQTFAQYAGLNVETINIMDETTHQMDSNGFDELLERLVSYDGVSVVDTGANTFSLFMAYIKANQTFESLKAEGVDVFVHTVIAGGDMAFDTLVGFNDIARALDVPLVVWFNGHSGNLVANGAPLSEHKVIIENLEKIVGNVTLQHPEPGFAKTLSIFNDNRLTYDEAKVSKDFKIAEKNRIRLTFEGAFKQLDMINFA